MIYYDVQSTTGHYDICMLLTSAMQLQLCAEPQNGVWPLGC
jgi:hypothetical protein